MEMASLFASWNGRSALKVTPIRPFVPRATVSSSGRSAGVISCPGRHMDTTRSTTFCSSRTLPGQSYSLSTRSASGLKRRFSRSYSWA